MADRDQLLDSIRRGERVLAQARADDAHLVVTERRIAVASDHGTLLDVELSGLRRIQFDIERDRPATLVVVPHEPRHAPQVLSVPPEEYGRAAELLVLVGRLLVGAGQERAGSVARGGTDGDAAGA